MRLLEIFPGYKEQFQLARLRYQPRNLSTVDHTRGKPSTVFLQIFGTANSLSRNGRGADPSRANIIAA
jgi:hypothetical protein